MKSIAQHTAQIQAQVQYPQPQAKKLQQLYKAHGACMLCASVHACWNIWQTIPHKEPLGISLSYAGLR